jgi:hypothetical protein
VRIDLHGYRPSEIVWNGLLIEIVRQCWEMGETELKLIHGHGRARGKKPGSPESGLPRAGRSGTPLSSLHKSCDDS